MDRRIAHRIVVAALLSLLCGVSIARAQSVFYLQDWESGAGGWLSKYGSSDPVALVSDATAPSPPTVQQITRQDTAGNYFSPLIPLQGGRTYCVASWVRWAGGGWPFVGIDNYDAGGVFLGENWLIGQAGYPTGYDGGDTVTPVPADTTDWRWYGKTITLRPEASSVRMKDELWASAAKPGDNLGLFDNLAIYDGTCPAHAPREVAIDIKPGSFPNSINLGSGGSVPVAILSTATFDATTVNPTTVTLAGASVRLKGQGTPMAEAQDVNGDGRLDLVVHVSTEALQLSDTDTVAVLQGQTFDGTPIHGTDTIRVVP